MLFSATLGTTQSCHTGERQGWCSERNRGWESPVAGLLEAAESLRQGPAHLPPYTMGAGDNFSLDLVLNQGNKPKYGTLGWW
jgi:hypothetical protein